jgi:P pilus assembly chaperone PapD
MTSVQALFTKLLIRVPAKLFSIFLIGLAVLSIVHPLKGVAQGNLLLLPKRVVFEGAKRFQEVNLSNIGNDTATYILSFVQMKMKENGAFEKITEPEAGQSFADQNVRFFPRSVTLAPNETQVVKVQLLKSNELEPGEYRSHLYFRAVPKEKPLGEEGAVKDSGISIKLVPIFGISIPVIVRKGEVTTDLSLSNVSFQMERDTIPTLAVSVNRTGNMSTYGDMWVEHLAPEGKVTRVGIIKGMAVYTPNERRDIRLALDKNSNVNYNAGTLHIVYSDETSKKIAQKEIFLH